MEKRKLSKVIPLLLVEMYWIMTYILYRFSAVKWPFANDNKTLIFVLACDGLFAIGYMAALKFFCKRKRENAVRNKNLISVLIWICVGISILTAIPNCIRYTGNWYPQIISSLSNPGETYLKMANLISSGRRWNIFGFLDFFNFAVFPLTFFAWDQIKTRLKIISCIVSFYYLIIYCSSGRNMPSMLFAFSVLVTYVALLCTDGIANKKKLIRNTVICIFSILLLFVMFKLNLASRTYYSSDVETQLAQSGIGVDKPDGILGSIQNNNTNNTSGNVHDKEGDAARPSYDEEPSETLADEKVYNKYKDLVITKEHAEMCEQVGKIFPMYTNPYTKAYVDPEDFVYKHLPSSLKFIYAMGIQYVSASYHTLGVALRMDFKWTYGIGCSDFLLDYFERFTGIDVKSRTYGARSVKLTSPPIVSTYGWSTAYVQLASDLTFAGVAILFLALGMLVASAWRDMLEFRNAFSLPFIIQIALFLIFVPMNCITFGSGGYFVTFFVSVFLWVIPYFRKWLRLKRSAE